MMQHKGSNCGSWSDCCTHLRTCGWTFERSAAAPLEAWRPNRLCNTGKMAINFNTHTHSLLHVLQSPRHMAARPSVEHVLLDCGAKVSEASRSEPPRNSLPERSWDRYLSIRFMSIHIGRLWTESSRQPKTSSRKSPTKVECKGPSASLVKPNTSRRVLWNEGTRPASRQQPWIVAASLYSTLATQQLNAPNGRLLDAMAALRSCRTRASASTPASHDNRSSIIA